MVRLMEILSVLSPYLSHIKECVYVQFFDQKKEFFSFSHEFIQKVNIFYINEM
jgi:hypothetical protein